MGAISGLRNAARFLGGKLDRQVAVFDAYGEGGETC
jgi:hypothetical protein